MASQRKRMATGFVCFPALRPCPMGCGGQTEDPWGGPCEKCAEAMLREGQP